MTSFKPFLICLILSSFLYAQEEPKKLLAIFAHPDDELLGLGASMNRLIRDFGAIVHVVILGEGITSRADKRDTQAFKEELEVHRSNMSKLGEDGKPIYREDGKVLKSDRYFKPNIAAILNK